jgi:hypothetical protein
MPAFRRVTDRQAGPAALGILVPPGRRTLVILRPRALSWDLLPIRLHERADFCEFGRDEAALLARQVHAALEQAQGDQQIQAQAAADGYRVCAPVGGHLWIVCGRAPGQAYRPALFATLDEAEAAARRVAAVLWPGPDAQQEVYFNTQNFTR